MLRDILEKKKLSVIHIDPDDIRLEYSINRGNHVTVDPSARVIPVRIDNRDVNYIELTFDPISLENNDGDDSADCVMVDDSYNIYFEARFSPELFRDLADRALVQDAESPLTLEVGLLSKCMNCFLNWQSQFVFRIFWITATSKKKTNIPPACMFRSWGSQR